MNRFHNSLGAEYDLFQLAVPHFQQLQSLVGEVVARWRNGRTADFKAIEIGTGTGITTNAVLKTGLPVRLLTIDSEPFMLDQARENLVAWGDQVSFLEKDALEALRELPTASVELVFSAWTIHNMPSDYRKMLFHEIRRVLKKGGLFVNGDKIAHDDSAFQQIVLEKQIQDFSVFEANGRRDLREEWTRHYLEDEEIKLTEYEQLSVLVGLGFLDPCIMYRMGMDAIVIARV